jgi:hypothetical protein
LEEYICISSLGFMFWFRGKITERKLFLGGRSGIIRALEEDRDHFLGKALDRILFLHPYCHRKIDGGDLSDMPARRLHVTQAHAPTFLPHIYFSYDTYINTTIQLKKYYSNHDTHCCKSFITILQMMFQRA